MKTGSEVSILEFTVQLLAPIWEPSTEAYKAWRGLGIRSLEETAGKLQLKDVKTAKSRRRLTLSRFALDALLEHRKQALAE